MCPADLHVAPRDPFKRQRSDDEEDDDDDPSRPSPHVTAVSVQPSHSTSSSSLVRVNGGASWPRDYFSRLLPEFRSRLAFLLAFLLALG